MIKLMFKCLSCNKFFIKEVLEDKTMTNCPVCRTDCVMQKNHPYNAAIEIRIPKRIRK